MIVELGVQSGTAFTAPAGVGFVQVINEQFNSGNARHGLFYRIDDGTPGPWAFTYGGSNVFQWWRAVTYSGHDPSAPINRALSQINAVSRSVVAPSITPDVAGCLLAYLGNPDGPTTSTWTPPSGMSAVDDIANGVFLAEEALGAPAATGARTGSVSTARANVGTLVAIAPRVVTLGRATETDTARTVAAAKTLGLGRAAEVDAARPVAVLKTVTLGRVIETDTARPLTAARSLQIGRAGEVDTARALTLVSTDPREPTDLPTGVTLANRPIETVTEDRLVTVTPESRQTTTTPYGGERTVTLDG